MRLEVTRKSDLAVCALGALARSGGRVKTADLAEQLDAAPAFMGQVLMDLVKKGWVESSPGPTGGYRLLADLDALTVVDVIEALEGPTDNDQCVVANSACGANGYCVLHQAWSEARSVLIAHLRSTSVLEAARRAKEEEPEHTTSDRGIRQEPADNDHE